MSRTRRWIGLVVSTLALAPIGCEAEDDADFLFAGEASGDEADATGDAGLVVVDPEPEDSPDAQPRSPSSRVACPWPHVVDGGFTGRLESP